MKNFPDPLTIEYKDARGHVTIRDIRLISREGEGRDMYLHAHCYEVDEIRTFRLDRILNIADEHGELIPIQEVFPEFFGETPTGKPKKKRMTIFALSVWIATPISLFVLWVVGLDGIGIALATLFWLVLVAPFFAITKIAAAIRKN